MGKCDNLIRLKENQVFANFVSRSEQAGGRRTFTSLCCFYSPGRDHNIVLADTPVDITDTQLESS